MNNRILIRLAEIVSYLFPKSFKENYELLYWRIKKGFKGNLSNYHFKEFFTDHFEISEKFYEGKKILDLGCGPSGSLEWAYNSLLRVGLDPLAGKYFKLGASKHKMNYVNASSEKIPFAENSFDLVSSFNSLDHVDNIDETITEAVRVLKPGGLFILITDVGHKATPFEPQEFSWNIKKKFELYFTIEKENQYERSDPLKIYNSIRKNIKFNHNDISKRYVF